jgi:hypothetical protein
MMLRSTLQRNFTQKNLGNMDTEIDSFKDVKISEQTETKKSIIPELSSKEVQSDLHSSLDTNSTNVFFIRENSSPLNERGSKFGQMENLDVHSPEIVDSNDLGLKLGDSKSKQDWKLVTDHEKGQISKKHEHNLIEDADSPKPQKHTSAFRELRESPWFIDKTKFIHKFYYYLGKATLILSPIKSGKTTTIDMLKEFYCVPRIDVKSYDPETKTHANMSYTAKDIFKGTFIHEAKLWNTVYDWNENKRRNDLEEAFVEENMSKWPVMVINFNNVRFDSKTPTNDEINKAIVEQVIQPTYEQYDYLLFIKIADKICKKKYKDTSSEAYTQLFEDLELENYESMRAKIDALWNYYGKEMTRDYQEFYKLYSKGPFKEKDISLSLKSLADILADYYGKQVIILADDHDVPVQKLLENRSFLDSDENEKMMKSIYYLSSVISSMLQKVGKNNKNIHSLAMFGVSNALFGSFGSSANYYETRDFFESELSKDFAMTEKEVVNTINKLLEIKEMQKKQIKSNIDAWYNGYNRESGPKLYQIYSTTRYLEDCYQEYKKKSITLNEKDGKWIPLPFPYTVSSKTAGLFNDYLSKGFSGEWYDAYINCYRGDPIVFWKHHHYRRPFLIHPRQINWRRHIIFSVLLQSGYLTHDYELKQRLNYVKIPNLEVVYLFENKLKEHLNSIPIEGESILNFSNAIIIEDFQRFGIELAKYMSKFDKSHKELSRTCYIHSLMLKLFDNLNSNSGDEFDTKIHNKLTTTRSKMQFHFGSAEKKEKTYYIIQLDEMYSKEDNEIENRVIERLESIFNLDYHRPILETGETATIIMMGMAAPRNKVCLATLKVNISDGRITKATAIKHLRF